MRARSMLITGTAILAGTLAAPAPSAAGAPVCNQAGPVVSCSDGTQYHTFANRTTDNRGRTWLHDREFTFGSDGTLIQRPPGQAYDPSPFAWPPYGTGPLGAQPGAMPGYGTPR